MSLLEPKIYTLLAGDSAVTALVRDRIYEVLAPQGSARPYIVYQRISGGQIGSLSGYSRLEAPRIQFGCWADSAPEARKAAKALKEAMETAVEFAPEILSDMDTYEENSNLFGRLVDFRCWHKEA